MEVQMDNTEDAALRGVYSSDEERLYAFRNGVPTFETIEECMEWLREHANYGSNPEMKQLRHIFTHFIGASQVQKYVLARLQRLPVKRFEDGGEEFYYTAVTQQSLSEDEMALGTRQNRAVSSFEFKPIVQELMNRLSLPIHRTINYASTINTFNYLFNHMRCGVLISIRENKLMLFAPFVNDKYKNNWSQHLKTDPPNLDDYYRLKRNFYREENIISVDQWWANGNILCNEHVAPREPFTHWWGDNLLPTFKHMLESMCRERKIPDVDFFFNKRDHPQLKANKTEPYDFLYDIKDKPLDQENYATYAPILSFYCSPRFADIPVPTTEDWESAVGKVFPPSFIPRRKGKKFEIEGPRDLYLKENFEKFHVEWEDKVNTAFFRGNATGGGTTPETNQRLKVAKICAEWNRTGQNGSNPPYLDAGVTGFNTRDKKLYGQPMRFTKPAEIGITKAGFVEMYKQGTFKYILYIDGHCAANRYSFLMRLGSVILKVESVCEASEMWFFPLLKPYEGSLQNNIDVGKGVMGADHVPIKADLSNLKEQLEWCRQNDEKCRQIAENARSKYQRCLSKDSILDYMQTIMVKIAKQYEHPPSWWQRPDPISMRPELDPPQNLCAKDHATHEFVLCKRCEKERAEEERSNTINPQLQLTLPSQQQQQQQYPHQQQYQDSYKRRRF